MHSPAGNTTQLVLGFPIRTSSDQRTVGNSPRLNAASHVLHRPSMPRHPPYARNTKQQLRSLQKLQTTQQTKITQKEQDARVHYTVLTQHTPHEDQPPQQMINHHGMPQQGTHNVAPDTQQHANTSQYLSLQNVLDIHAPKRAHPTTTPHTRFKHDDHGWVCLHPDIFKTNWWQYHTRVLNHHTHNCGRKIKAP